MTKKRAIPQEFQVWIEARRRHPLSHAHVQMARKLGLNPKKLGKIDNHRQEPWKLPLPEFIEHLYFKRFGRARSKLILTIEERARLAKKKQMLRKGARATTAGHRGGFS